MVRSDKFCYVLAMSVTAMTWQLEKCKNTGGNFLSTYLSVSAQFSEL